RCVRLVADPRRAPPGRHTDREVNLHREGPDGHCGAPCAAGPPLPRPPLLRLPQDVTWSVMSKSATTFSSIVVAWTRNRTSRGRETGQVSGGVTSSRKNAAAEAFRVRVAVVLFTTVVCVPTRKSRENSV